MKGRKVNRIGHILRGNRLLIYVIEGKIEGRTEVTEWRGRWRKQLLYDLKEEIEYWILKEEAIDHTLWRTGFGRGCGPVVGQTAGWMNLMAEYSGLLRHFTAVWRVITDVSKEPSTLILKMEMEMNEMPVLATPETTVMRRLTTGIRSNKCVVRQFRRCANVIECTYTNLDSTVWLTTHLYYMI